MDTIKQFLEADAKRTQGEWIAGLHPANHKMNIIKPIMFGDRVGKLPEHEGSHAFFRNQDDANFIALASTLAPAIRTMMERLEKLEAEHNSALAGIEMAREALLEGIITECEIEWQDGDGSWARETPSHIRKIYAIAHHALSALGKYKPTTEGSKP